MAKEKKDKRSRYSDMVKRAAEGFAAKPGSNIYREYKDYNPSATDERTSIGGTSRSGKTPAQWASTLVTSGGKSAGDVFRMDGKMYKIISGGRPGSIGAEEIKI
tara:strand:- start:575 stop:886 length:312 start_codon:yes stop_codon:yes gene_type:complete